MLNVIILHDHRPFDGDRSTSMIDLAPLISAAMPEGSNTLKKMREADIIMVLDDDSPSPSLGVLIKDRGTPADADIEVERIHIGRKHSFDPPGGPA